MRIFSFLDSSAPLGRRRVACRGLEGPDVPDAVGEGCMEDHRNGALDDFVYGGVKIPDFLISIPISIKRLDQHVCWQFQRMSMVERTRRGCTTFPYPGDHRHARQLQGTALQAEHPQSLSCQAPERLIFYKIAVILAPWKHVFPTQLDLQLLSQESLRAETNKLNLWIDEFRGFFLTSLT